MPPPPAPRATPDPPPARLAPVRPGTVAAVAVGGAAGSLARWAVVSALPAHPDRLPWGTLLVNVAGCLLLGALIVGSALRWPDVAWLRPLLGAGVLGGLTTFSAYAVEVRQLAGHRPVLALGYAAGSVVLGLLAVLAGAAAGRALVARAAS